ncbi:phosphatase PAP2 family protein [Catellatospora chokoriensis]|uniref:Phosphatidic acid phosphatase type 2/haloperoxidase domain-containing protein n=1 Tax=Catellatospora chokoriensis TaxID=310353 RepID=A0A8J3KDD3_9ACTN|nr:phosphatase PAP2 family protein [Catellatospora chokoriensis]GIF92979.1 hypothetical protein Cch02nite_64230 [Catellatospora chokoriensis]
MQNIIGIVAAIIVFATTYGAAWAIAALPRRRGGPQRRISLGGGIVARSPWSPRRPGLAVARTIAATAAVLAGGSAALTLATQLALLDPWDMRGVQWAVDHRTTAMTTAAISVTDVGSAPCLITVTAIATIAVSARRRSATPAALGLVVLGGIQLLVNLIKIMAGRPRPDTALWLVDVTGPSFPSGHAGSSTATLGLLAWLACTITSDRRIRSAAWTTAAAMAVAIGLTRVYLGVHYPSDVLGGWLIGGLWLTVVALACRVHRQKGASGLSRSPAPSAPLIPASLLLD